MRIKLYASTGEDGKMEHIPYTSIKWERGMSRADFAVKIRKLTNFAVKLGGDWIEIKAQSLEHPSLKDTWMAVGEWIVLNDNNEIVGTYDDKTYNELYEIVRDWR